MLSAAKRDDSSYNTKPFLKEEYVQAYLLPEELNKFKINYCDISKDLKSVNNLRDVLSLWQSDFNPAENYMFQVGVIVGYRDGSSRIYFALHHLLVDAVSWRIICHDLELIYRSLVNVGLPSARAYAVNQVLGIKGTSYRQWVERLKSYSLKNQAERAYWDKELLLLTQAQTKWESLCYTNDTKTHHSFKLDKKMTQLLLTKVNQAYNTEINDILLSAFGLAVATISKETLNYITLESHGREEIDKYTDINRTVGWFTSMYPVKLHVDQSSLRNTIIRTKENLRKIPDKGICYGEIYGYANLPRISFNYLGQFAQESNQEKDKTWIITSESSGVTVSSENCDINVINANGLIRNKELFFGISSKLKEEDLNRLTTEFKRQLELIIKHTAAIPRSYLTSSDIDNIITQDYLDQIQEKTEISQVYLANSLQQGFISHALSNSKDTAYRVQSVYTYNNELEPDLLKKSWQGAIKKYPSLRLRFAWDNELVQIVDKEQDLAWAYHDLSNMEEVYQEKAIAKLIVNDRNTAYDLAHGNLLRIHLIKCRENKYHCIKSNHHAILDGWSVPRLFHYVHKLYVELEKNNLKTLEKLLADITAEEAYTLSQKYLQDTYKDVEIYWQKELERIDVDDPNLSGLLKVDKKHIKLSEYRLIKDKTEIQTQIKGVSYEELKQLSYKCGITINTLLQYAWHKLLSVYGNNKITIVGTTVSGRNLPIDGIEESIGLYINTLPLIIEHDPEQSLRTAFKNLQDKINDLNTYSNVSLAKLQKDGRRLFNSLFVYENYPISKSQENSRIKLRFEKSIEELDYPLAVIAYEGNNEITINIKYAGELFSKETINRLLNTFRNILTEITNKATHQVEGFNKEVGYLNKDEYKKIIYQYNQTEKSYPQEKTIQQLFEEQVTRTPNNIAVIYEETKLTYYELNKRSNQLANYLRRRYKINEDDLITLCLDRSEHMLIGILAVLKSGGAYVPIDPRYPDERIHYILEDTKSKVVLMNKAYQEKVATILLHGISSSSSAVGQKSSISINHKPVVADFCVLDDINFQAKLKKEVVDNPKVNVRSNNLAYVIYTSGTTGKPKGVMIEHQNVVTFILGFKDKLKVSNVQPINMLSTTNYVFDIFGLEYILPLFNGYSVDLVNTTNFLNQNCIIKLSRYDYIQLTPSKVYLLLSQISNERLRNLHTVRLLIGGEALNENHINQIRDYETKHKNIKFEIINVYGPTESTIWSTMSMLDDGSINIGKPLYNETVYILDNNLKPVPQGAVGVLYIGGAGLARGYLNNLGLTNEMFMANPFQSKSEQVNGENLRIYKTGDLVRMLVDGNIEYIGRNDFQVKVRGYRIELGEIEGKLLGYPGIKQAVVLAYEHAENRNQNLEDKGDENGASGQEADSGIKYLVGYYMSLKVLNNNEILEYLSKCLPEYMVPSMLSHLDSLPLTPNGKLDRKALPNPEFKDTSSEYVAPRDGLDGLLVAIFSNLLGMEESKLSIRSDFFGLGGNSILAIKLVSQLNKELAILRNVKLKVTDIFINRSVERLVNYIESELSTALIKCLNTSNSSELMFMFHPGGGGCEIYTDLANVLSEQYKCYGIDNYNIHNKKQIASLYQLAKIYLAYIEEVRVRQKINLKARYNLVGWSLGGQIALAVASLLEKKGIINIRVICLDSIMTDGDSKLNKIRGKGINMGELADAAMKQYKDKTYVNQILQAIATEKLIAQDTIKTKLKYTKIVLFKGTRKDDRFKSTPITDQFSKHILALPYNNIDKVVSHIDNVEVILLDCHHGNILDKAAEIANKI